MNAAVQGQNTWCSCDEFAPHQGYKEHIQESTAGRLGDRSKEQGGS